LLKNSQIDRSHGIMTYYSSGQVKISPLQECIDLDRMVSWLIQFWPGDTGAEILTN
jgi:hypothetical protein